MFTKHKSMYLIVIAIISITLFSSCGGDDECVQSEWIGTYNLEENHMCPDSILFLKTVITIEAGTSANSIFFEGESFSITDCFGTGPAGINLELDGDMLKVGESTCSGEYTKQ